MADEQLGKYSIGVGLDMSEFQGNMQAAVAGVTAAAAQMVDSMNSMTQQIEQATSGTGRGLNDAADKLSENADEVKGRWAGVADTIKSSFSSIQTAIGGAALAISAAIGGAVKHTLDFEGAVLRLQLQTGMTVQQASAWTGMAQQWGVDSQVMTVGMRSLANHMEMVKKGSGAAEQAFQRYGIAVKNDDGTMRSMNDVMLDAAEKIHKMGAGQASTALAMQTFGRAGMQLLPMLLQGKEYIENNRKAMERYGIILSDTNAYAKYKAATRDFELASMGIQHQLAEGLIPVITDMSLVISNALKWFNSLNTSTDGMVTEFIQWTAAIGLMVGGAAALGKVLTALGGPFAIVGNWLSSSPSLIGAVVSGYSSLVTWLVNSTMALGDFSKMQQTTAGITAAVQGAIAAMRYEVAVCALAFQEGGVMGLVKYCASLVTTTSLAGVARIALTLLWGAATAGITIVIALAVAWATNLGNISKDCDSFTDFVMDSFKVLWEGIKQVAEGIWKVLKGAFTLNPDLIKEGINQAVDTLKAGVKKLGGVLGLSGLMTPTTPPPGTNDDGGGGDQGGTDPDKHKGHEHEQDAFEQARDQYELQISLAEKTAAEKLALYDKIVGAAEKTSKEETDYAKEHYRLSEAARQEAYQLAKIATDNELADTSKSVAEQYRLKLELNTKDLALHKEGTVQHQQALAERLGIDRWYQQQLQQLAQQKRDAEKAQADFELDTAKSTYDFEVEMGKHTVEEQIKYNEQYLKAKAKAEKDALGSEEDALKKGEQAHNEYAAKVKAIDNKLKLDLQKNSQDLVKEQTKDFRQMAETVSNTVGEAFKGLVKGTMSWKEAFRSVGQSILSEWTNMGAKLVTNWAKQQMQRLLVSKTAAATDIATTAGAEAAKTAAEAGGTAARIAQAQAGAGASIAASSAAASASVAATGMSFSAIWTSILSTAQAILSIPVVGWVIGAAMIAGVMRAISGAHNTQQAASAAATNTKLPSFDVGSWNVPNDMIANIHKGEVIVPANFADKARGMMSGEGAGGQPIKVEYNVTAFDGTDVKRVLKKHGGLLVGALKDQNRNFAFSVK